jgi:hypothetical protein
MVVLKAGGTMENGIYEAFCIEGGRKCFYQWDLNQKIIVNDGNIDEVHFCNGTSDKSLVCMVKDGAASVPNILLQTAGKVKVYGYSVNHTVVEKVYEVKARTKPEDYVYEETEVYRWAELDKRILALEEMGEPEKLELALEEIFGDLTGGSYLSYSQNHKALKLIKCRVEIEYAGDTAGAIDLTFGTYEFGQGITQLAAKVKARFTPEKRYAAVELYPNNGYWDMTFYGAAAIDEAPPVFGMPKEYAFKKRINDIPHIECVHFLTDRESGIGMIPKGTIARIYGLWAKE